MKKLLLIVVLSGISMSALAGTFDNNRSSKMGTFDNDRPYTQRDIEEYERRQDAKRMTDMEEDAAQRMRNSTHRY